MLYILEQILWHTNYNLESVVTLVNVYQLEKLLIESEYNEYKTAKLLHGFRHGFSLGYKGDTNIQQTVAKLKLHVGSKTELWNKVMKEVGAKRFAGPFKEPPFENFIQSLIGLVSKDRGENTTDISPVIS